MILTFIIAATVGVFIGMASGLLGIGGGVVMVPVFRLAFGLSPVGATGTSLFTIIPTSVSGTVSHLRGKTCVPKLGLALGVGGACTSPLGVWLANVSPGWLVMAAVAVVIVYSAFTMFRKAFQAPKATFVGEQPAPTPPVLASSDLVRGVLIGALAGAVSGYIGLGGGFLMVPLMVSLLNMPMRLTSGTSLIAVMILAIPATVTQCALGNVDFLIGIATACGSIPGAAFSARLVKRIPERTLRFLFAAFLCVAAILLIVKELGVLG